MPDDNDISQAQKTDPELQKLILSVTGMQLQEVPLNEVTKLYCNMYHPSFVKLSVKMDFHIPEVESH